MVWCGVGQVLVDMRHLKTLKAHLASLRTHLDQVPPLERHVLLHAWAIQRQAAGQGPMQIDCLLFVCALAACQ